jgi:hypothetical protein
MSMFRGNGARTLRSKTLILALPLLFLAGCSTPDQGPVAQQPRLPARSQGIDLPTDAGHVAHYIKNNGLDFVARYYRKPDSRWPALSANEARVLSAMGLNVVAVWESYSHKRDYFTYGRGYWDAVAAARQAKGVGQPAGSAIYFAVDFDATTADMYPIDQYFRGITAGLAASSGGTPEYKVGVYGSGAVCDAVKRARLAQYAWLSNSTGWAGRGFGGWNIRQGRPYANLGFNHDSNEARDDYGGFRLAGM